MAALHVGSERLLAGFDDWKGSHTLDALRGRRILIIFLLVLIEVFVILEVLLVDRVSVAVPFGATFPAHVNGTYLSTDSG